jgi:hypothetical protein
MSDRFTVGSLLGVPLGRVPEPPAPAAAEPALQAPLAASPESPEAGGVRVEGAIEGPAWRVTDGVVSVGGARGAFLDGGESLTYDNPFGQTMERVWFAGRVVFALDLGEVDVDPASVKVAQEYQVVYSVDLDERGKAVGEPEMVPGQLNIYDSVPGMDAYSPIWQFNYVVVPRDYRPNTLRSAEDCLASGHPIHRSNDFEN